MSKIWKINGVPLADLGLTITAGTFRVQAVSSITLEQDLDFDEEQALEYGDAVILTHEEPPPEDPGDPASPVIKFFQGKVISNPRYASGEAEGQALEIADAWHELETTIYQEQWGFGVLSEAVEDEGLEVHLRENIYVPRFVFGMNTAGTRITVGAQIGNAITYAASVGVAIQLGSVPSGEIPIPSELTNIDCASIIGMCLKLHPEWMPWIDHTTTPPTFNVTAVGAMTAVAFPLDGTGNVADFQVIKRDDLMPESVRIVYDFAGQANIEGDPEIFRKAYVDKWPLDGPSAGPRVLSAAIPLQGMQMQTQKSRIQARTIPIVGTTSAEDAKAWLRAHYLHLQDLEDTDFNITAFTKAFIEEPDDHADPINPRATRLTSDDLDAYPRELVRGQIEDWMRVRVRKIKITPSVTVVGTSVAAKKAARIGFEPFSIVATNARTKTYHGASEWVAPENVPTGIAQAVYESIRAGCQWQGDVTLEDTEVYLEKLIGKTINLTESANTEIAEMAAPIQGVSWDIESGTTTIDFGPVPYLAPTDFIELQRLFRQLPVKWWSSAERTSDKIGAEDDASAAGDTVGAYDLPETMHMPGGGAALPCVFGSLEGGKIVGGPVTAGGSNFNVENYEITPFGDGEKLVSIKVDGIAFATDDDDETILPGVTGADTAEFHLSTGPDYPDNVNPTTPTDLATIYVPLGVLTETDGVHTFAGAACGPITIGQCDGLVNYDRIGSA